MKHHESPLLRVFLCLQVSAVSRWKVRARLKWGINLIRRQFARLIQSSPSTGTHVAALDGVRGLALLIVMLAHTDVAGLSIIPGVHLGGAGKAGVWLFFVLSAYLLTSQLLALREAERLDGSAWRRYAVRRVLRIYPLFGMFVLFAWLTEGRFGAPLISGEGVVRHFAMMEGGEHLWSIPVEFKFYALLPLVVLAFVAMRNVWLVSGAVAVAVALITTYPPQFKVDALAPYLAVFLLGSCLAVIVRQLPVGLRWADTIGAAALLVAIALSPKIWAVIVGHPIAQGHFHFAFTLFAVLWCVFVGGMLLGKGSLSKIFSHPILRFLGVISFGAYVLHYLVIDGVVQLKLPPYVGGWLTVAGIVMVSTLSYLLIERPFLNLAARSPALQPAKAAG